MRETGRANTAKVVEIIVSAARASGVPVHVALAFADLESALHPGAEGDRDWSSRQGGALYRKHVLESVRLRDNPARLIPEAWHSYGLYQLAAAYHALPRENPAELLDATINATRGCAFIATLLKRTRADVERARLAYVGCGFDGERCSIVVRDKVKSRLRAALEKWGAHHVS
jgi:soluble lytic murein transglycosylase-like protein